ncbi:hypothetical protein GF342_02560 [Candidatus Woesearchaeota archaeon]|nr:hypothetical protein [Candidatus Woesearchaeota archaeon]
MLEELISEAMNEDFAYVGDGYYFVYDNQTLYRVHYDRNQEESRVVTKLGRYMESPDRAA